MKKIMFMRGPDGAFHEFHRTGEMDDWTPIPGQDIQIQGALTGAGWFLVASVRPVYSASPSHTTVKLELAGSATTVYVQHQEVYLEEKRLKACESCGHSALVMAKFCFNCGAALPAEGARFTQPPLAPRQGGRKST